jgi:copper(I)-binding protein
MRNIALLVVGLMALTMTVAAARDYKAGPIQVADPWSRATPRGAETGVGYMKITNTGTSADRLLGGSVNVDVAATLEVHDMAMENHVMKMRAVKGGLELKPGKTVELKPGGLHVMFVGLKKPLAAGDRITATLEFEKAGKIEIEYEVRPMGAGASGSAGGHGH